jgi:uncharacterized membrane protein
MCPDFGLCDRRRRMRWERTCWEFFWILGNIPNYRLLVETIQTLMPVGCLSLLAALVLMAVLPWLFLDVMSTALLKLQLAPQTATLIVMGILFGGLINIPVKRIEREELVPVDPFALFGLGQRWRDVERARMETIVAVNVGGCIIPASLATYEISLLMQTGAMAALVGAIVLNVAVCYRLARPVRGVGILMPGLIPPLVAASSALLLAPVHATPIAFIAGTFGPLIGADLLHLRQVERMDTGIVSIGGAGTFDGILLSGIVALYLS